MENKIKFLIFGVEEYYPSGGLNDLKYSCTEDEVKELLKKLSYEVEYINDEGEKKYTYYQAQLLDLETLEQEFFYTENLRNVYNEEN